MNLPNKLTMLRIALIPVFAALMMLPGREMQLWAMIAFVVASVTDLLDGYLARKWGQVTDFGKLMDPMADKLLVLSALVGLLALGRAHWLCVLILLGREFVIMSIRLVAAGKGTVIAADMLGKIKTVLQMLAIAFILFPYWQMLNTLGDWLLWASTVMSIWSCFSYIRNNWEVLRP